MIINNVHGKIDFIVLRLNRHNKDLYYFEFHAACSIDMNDIYIDLNL